MIFRQFIYDDLGCGSYLVGDEDAGIAAVIDPKLDVEDYLAMARYMGVRIEHILETHNHADHVSGHGRLAAATGEARTARREYGARVRATGSRPRDVMASCGLRGVMH
jgi:hydroxyacylglutathione hydrolase